MPGHAKQESVRVPKALRWVGASRRVLQGMPEDVKDVFGFALHELQRGETPRGARPFGEGLDRRIGKLVCDAEDTNTYRLAYTAVFPEVVYVLDVFEKKSRNGRATPRADRERVMSAFRAALADYEHTYRIRR